MSAMDSSDLCSKCLGFLDPRQQQSSPKESQENDESSSSTCCPVCLGLWDGKALRSRLEKLIAKACEPYGGFSVDASQKTEGANSNNIGNRFSIGKDPPVISLPGDVAFRYHTASKLPQYQNTAKPQDEFIQRIKQFANDQLMFCIRKLERDQELESEQISSSNDTKNGDDIDEKYPPFVAQEEQGYLALRVLVATSKAVPRPPASQQQRPRQPKRRRHKPFETQGGHPTSNLEKKLQQHEGHSIHALWSIPQAVEMINQDRNIRSISRTDEEWFVVPSNQCDKSGNGSGGDDIKIRSITIESNSEGGEDDQILQLHVALWRRPFLVMGNYTKTRRDVSQSPFFVDGDNPKKRKRLGITSIEEQILPPLVEICGGISTCNESPDANSNVIYGKAKFHASGREDMDVRMILPTFLSNDNDIDLKNITGRPFCCEVIDALRMPSMQDLKQLVDTINLKTDSVNPTLLPKSTQYYGQSPLGVGVDPSTLSFAKADVFKNLQGETESKHKFYGCLCWSEEVLPPSQALIQRITISSMTNGDSSPAPSNEHSSENNTVKGQFLFPLEIKQKTPIRVLHRRANAVRIRHILSCHHVERLDDHFFRLHISTDAGTYVKEFCHGDLGRTQPNLSTLLGCKTDILELDCEGIKIK